MIIYKDIKGKLKEAGYSTYRLQKENLLSPSVINQLNKNKPISLATLDTLCELTGLQPGDLIEHIPNKKQ